jgi:hypothetical protein
VNTNTCYKNQEFTGGSGYAEDGIELGDPKESSYQIAHLKFHLGPVPELAREAQLAPRRVKTAEIVKLVNHYRIGEDILVSDLSRIQKLEDMETLPEEIHKVGGVYNHVDWDSLGHVDPSLAGIAGAMKITPFSSEESNLLLDGYHRACKAFCSDEPFFVYRLTTKQMLQICPVLRDRWVEEINDVPVINS